MTFLLGTFSTVARRLVRGVKRHGAGGLLLVGLERMFRELSTLKPSVRRQIREREQRSAEFDRRLGVDTSGTIHPAEMDVDSSNLLYAVSYRGSDPESFTRALEILPLAYGNFQFIDFGSGKGRAVLLAAEFAFAKIIGVEFSEQLHRVAQEREIQLREY
jgi:hypothetical protein